MQVTPIAPSFSGKNIYVPKNAKPNKDRTYLYNEVIEIVNKHHTPAVVKNNGIEITATNAVMEKLKELGIKFVENLKS